MATELPGGEQPVTREAVTPGDRPSCKLIARRRHRVAPWTENRPPLLRKAHRSGDRGCAEEGETEEQANVGQRTRSSHRCRRRLPVTAASLESEPSDDRDLERFPSGTAPACEESQATPPPSSGSALCDNGEAPAGLCARRKGSPVMCLLNEA